ncbi:hypothetical protein MKX01_037302 [Papaver californicum]|nr:hypothetical protein MKX01_037302 [Papaver californicum]
MAAKILANLIIMGSGIMVRAFAQAYKQALNTNNKTMTGAEARQILGVSEQTSWEDVLKAFMCYDTLSERNAKNGSFYLQSKVHRAKEMLETVHKGPDPDKGPDPRTCG